MKKNNGCFWHIHHDVLCEWTNNIQERIAYIRKEKPANEIKTRLKLMKPVKGELPDKFVKALEVFNIARKAYHKSFIWEAHVKTRKDYDKAREAYDKKREACKPQLEALHKKECGCKEWNGIMLIFKKGEKKC